MTFPFSNNCSNSCLLRTKLLAYFLVAHPSLVQVYNVVPDVLCLAHGGNVGM